VWNEPTVYLSLIIKQESVSKNYIRVQVYHSYVRIIIFTTHYYWLCCSIKVPIESVTAMCSLEPIGIGREYLCSIPLDFNKEVVIGRNEKTFLPTANSLQYFTYVSRHQFSIKWISGGVFIKVSDNVKSVTIDGKLISYSDDFVKIENNAVVTLLHKFGWFNYRLVVSPDTNSCLDNSAKSYSQIKALTGIAECAICLSVIASAQSAVPCGHSFCFCCLADWIKSASKSSRAVSIMCPSCQGPIDNTAPNCVLDSVIEGVVVGAVGEQDAADELVDWRGRVDSGLQQRKSSPIVLTSKHFPVPLVASLGRDEASRTNRRAVQDLRDLAPSTTLTRAPVRLVDKSIDRTKIRNIFSTTAAAAVKKRKRVASPSRSSCTVGNGSSSSGVVSAEGWGCVDLTGDS
jgi:hypothetical protein